MQGYVLVFSLLILVSSVILRSAQLKKMGIKAVLFGAVDKKDFIIPPFVLFYLYLIFANTFNLPRVGFPLADTPVAEWVGVVLCVSAVILFIGGIISFGKSFRVGIDENRAGELVSSGVFAFSRNPLYLAFAMILLGVFLIFPEWIFFVYLIAGMWLIDRQVCLEENSLRRIYGREYDEYCNKVRRYI